MILEAKAYLFKITQPWPNFRAWFQK